jgi:DNA polymerase (family X)
MALDASAVAKLLHELGQRTALRGGNPYRARAYSRAAGNLLALTMPLDQIVAEDRLREIPGVGDAIADIIAKLHKTGTHAGLEAMRKDIPAGVLELLSVPGLRPEKVLKLYNELGIASLEGLEQAARQDRLKNVKGLGAALQSRSFRASTSKGAGRASAICIAPRHCSKWPKRICGGRTPASHAL